MSSALVLLEQTTILSVVSGESLRAIESRSHVIMRARAQAAASGKHQQLQGYNKREAPAAVKLRMSQPQLSAINAAWDCRRRDSNIMTPLQPMVTRVISTSPPAHLTVSSIMRRASILPDAAFPVDNGSVGPFAPSPVLLSLRPAGPARSLSPSRSRRAGWMQILRRVLSKDRASAARGGWLVGMARSL